MSKFSQPAIPPDQTRVSVINVIPGQQVKKGELLIEFETQELEIKLLDAKAKLSDALSKLETIQNWEFSSEVVNSKRELESAE